MECPRAANICSFVGFGTSHILGSRLEMVQFWESVSLAAQHELLLVRTCRIAVWSQRAASLQKLFGSCNCVLRETSIASILLSLPHQLWDRWQSSSAAIAMSPRRCNGYEALCRRRYSNVTYVSAHNSPFYIPGNPGSNQFQDLETQLNDGVRMCT